MIGQVTGTAGAEVSSRISRGRIIDTVIDYGMNDRLQPSPVGFDDRSIVALPGSKFELKEPIPVRLEGNAEEGWIASFEDAEIAMSGDTVAEATDALAENIAFAMELHVSEEDNLNDHLRGVLATLRRYIGVKDDQET